MNTVTILKSIADETRLSIVRKSADEGRELPCSEILTDCSIALNLSQPTMSHHLARLVQSGVLLEKKVGKEKYYQLNHDLLATNGLNPLKF